MKRLVTIFLILLALVACGGSKAVTPQQVIDAFQAAGLEAESPRAMAAGDYGMAPMAAEGIRFLVPAICDKCGGRVMSYASTSDRDNAKSYYDELSQVSATFFSWTFTRDNVLVQINGDLPEAQARLYEGALVAIK